MAEQHVVYGFGITTSGVSEFIDKARREAPTGYVIKLLNVTPVAGIYENDRDVTIIMESMQPVYAMSPELDIQPVNINNTEALRISVEEIVHGRRNAVPRDSFYDPIEIEAIRRLSEKPYHTLTMDAVDLHNSNYSLANNAKPSKEELTAYAVACDRIIQMYRALRMKAVNEYRGS